MLEQYFTVSPGGTITKSIEIHENSLYVGRRCGSAGAARAGPRQCQWLQQRSSRDGPVVIATKWWNLVIKQIDTMEHLSSPTDAITNSFGVFSRPLQDWRWSEKEIINEIRNLEFLFCVCFTIQNSMQSAIKSIGHKTTFNALIDRNVFKYILKRLSLCC